MSKPSYSHLWIRGGQRSDRQARVQSLGLPAAIAPTLDAHRRLRGPYTAAGALVRELVPAVLASRPDLVARHDIELLSVAPELSTTLPNSHETLTSMAIPTERTRFYARLRTRRISNGLVEFVRDSLDGSGPRVLVVENVEHAEQTDMEFLARLLRRTDPESLTVVVCTATDQVPDDELATALQSYAEVDQILAADGFSAESSPSGADAALAWTYIETECTSDDRRLRLAYEVLDQAERARLHELRAEQLQRLDQQSLRLGAIPYHLERGTDPTGAGAAALYAAQDYCVCIGFYQVAVDFGYRGLALVDPKEQEELWWMITVELGLALSVLSRTDEAEVLYDKARLLSVKPMVHMAAAYSTAMLYTRHKDAEDRNEHTAKRWLNSAIATASLIEDPSERAFQSAFYRNGLALVEVNLGEPLEALRLVNGCIESLDQDLKPDEHRLHRSVLKNNRARVYASLRRLDDALADYAVVIEQDPNHAEHYLERGNILRRLARYDEAFADYETAMRLSPPFPEIYYNRGDLRMTVDDLDGALADFSYVLELDPDFVDAYVNRAGLYIEAGDLDGAHRDAIAGLERDPDNPYLHVVLGQVHAAREELDEAKAAFDRALEADATMIMALSARAALACEMGEVDSALGDLGRALKLTPDDAELRYNRAFAFRSCGRWDEALADLVVAAALAPDDADIRSAREQCEQMAATV